MLQTTAQRQAAYRARRTTTGDGDARLNTWISSAAHQASGWLARHHGLTRRELLEDLIFGADRDTLERDTPAWEHYFGVTP